MMRYQKKKIRKQTNKIRFEISSSNGIKAAHLRPGHTLQDSAYIAIDKAPRGYLYIADASMYKSLSQVTKHDQKSRNQITKPRRMNRT